MKTRWIISRLLLAFVLVSIGFAAGRETAGRPANPPGAAPDRQGGGQGAMEAGGADKVVVYYMHATFRCITCNQIEAFTDSLVRAEFAGAIQSGRLEWKRVNFQDEEDLAKRYGVGTSCVVVVSIRGGREVAFRRLDEVWTKVGNQGEFFRYVGDAIRKYLEAVAS